MGIGSQCSFWMNITLNWINELGSFCLSSFSILHHDQLLGTNFYVLTFQYITSFTFHEVLEKFYVVIAKHQVLSLRATFHLKWIRKWQWIHIILNLYCSCCAECFGTLLCAFQANDYYNPIFVYTVMCLSSTADDNACQLTEICVLDFTTEILLHSLSHS